MKRKKKQITRKERPSITIEGNDSGAPLGVIGFAWYSRNGWHSLKEKANDKEVLHDTYEEWEKSAENAIDKLATEGYRVEKVDVEFGELLSWCVKENKPVNGSARSQFATLKLQKKYENYKCISSEIIQECIDELHGFNFERLEEFSNMLHKTQPALMVFFDMFMEKLNDDAVEIIIFCFLVIWKSYEKAVGGNIDEIKVEEIHSTIEKVPKIYEMANRKKKTVNLLKLNKFLAGVRQHDLYRYVVEALLLPIDENEYKMKSLEIEVGKTVLFTIIECLDKNFNKA